MWCSLLEQQPEIIAHNLGLLAETPIPDSLHHNSVAGKECIPLGIVELLGGVAVATTIGFNNQSSLGTIEIQRVFSERMLAAKLVA